MFEFFEHTADVGIRVSAETRELALEEAGRALSSLIVENLDDVWPLEDVRIELPHPPVSADDEEDYLLFDWLSALLREFETTRRVFSRFDVQRTREGIVAECRGELLDPGRHRLGHEVKAITYHEPEFRPVADGGWRGQVIVDL